MRKLVCCFILSCMCICPVQARMPIIKIKRNTVFRVLKRIPITLKVAKKGSTYLIKT